MHVHLIPRGSINEYTYENGIQFEIKSLQSFRLYFFIASEGIISVIVDQNFTMNATGMVLESLCLENKYDVASFATCQFYINDNLEGVGSRDGQYFDYRDNRD